MRFYLSSFRIGNRPEEFRSLLGGQHRTGVIHNAVDLKPAAERKTALQDEVRRLEQIGLEPTEIDLRDWFTEGDGLRAHLASFALIWVRGGNTFVLRRAFRQSGADTALTSLLQNDAVVYAGYSAGVCVLSPSLLGIDLVDEPQRVPEGYGEEVVWEGLGLLPYAVAPHFRSPHPESEAMEGTVQYFIDHHIPFVALRDGEAIVINGENMRVVG